MNSKSLRAEIDDHLEVDPQKVQADLRSSRSRHLQTRGPRQCSGTWPRSVSPRLFVLFVSSLWRYKNCDGLLHAWRLAREELAGRQLSSSEQSATSVMRRAARAGRQLGIGEDVVFVGAVPNEETVSLLPGSRSPCVSVLQRDLWAADTRGDGLRLPGRHLLLSSMPEIAGGAASSPIPTTPGSIARSMLDACGIAASRLRTEGILRPAIHMGRRSPATSGCLS